MQLSVNKVQLMSKLNELGSVGRDKDGRLCRVAATDADKLGRDLFCNWLQQAGLRIEIDRIGNIYGFWEPDGASGAPVLMGSHIDTVIDAGIYDGCYGVLSGLVAIEAMMAANFKPSRAIALVAFTNEEGVRYAPDMMGSLVVSGGMSVDDALATIGIDGSILGAELKRIGYAGTFDPAQIAPHAYVELHVEQGPVLEAKRLSLGAVDNLQGISWQKITIRGSANHAGTTPMSMRKDAGVAAARVIKYLDDMARSTANTVSTVGVMQFEPNAINVIPATATFTVDLRNPDEKKLQSLEASLNKFLDDLRNEGYEIALERLARFEPVIFSPKIVKAIEKSALARQHSCIRMTSGAGHDAQMMARITPSGMIFVPSRGGISHNPEEFTEESELLMGANILLDVVMDLSR